MITSQHSSAILVQLYKDLRPKFKIMGTFPLIKRSEPTELGGVNLRSLQITSVIKAIQHIVSLFTRDTPSNLPMLTVIECHQLEVGVEQLFLSSSYPKPHKLVISTWKTRLW